MKIKIAVVDDDIKSRNKILGLLTQFMSSAEEYFEIREYGMPRELLFDLDQGKYYDLFLLDVEMDGVSGIELGREIRQRYLQPFIVYITDYVAYAIEAIEVNTFRYIPKQCIEEKLPEALKLMIEKLKDQKKECYLIKYYLDTEVIQVKDIYGLKKEDKYIVLYHTRGESRVRKPLKEVLRELDSEEFLETGRGYAVNVRHILSLRKHEVILRNGMVFPVGRHSLNEIKDGIEKFWMRKS